MPLGTLDWCIAVFSVIFVIFIAYRVHKYVQSVSDFMAGGRVAGRYVVAVAGGEAAFGLISLVGLFEMYYNSGFAFSFWNSIATPINLFFTLTGFIIYRFRETRCLTLAQFFEVRYSKRFRFFSGILIALSGILNYGIFPAVSARCLIHYCNLPEQVSFGGWHVPTMAIAMFLFLSIAILVVMLGGQITNMVTDCIQGIISYGIYAVIVIVLIKMFTWDEMSAALLARPEGKSMLNPYDIGKLQDFNIYYIIIGILGGVYNRFSWQGTQGFNCAAASPHEQKMGAILSTWRGGFLSLMIILLSVCAYTYMNHPDFAQQSQAAKDQIAAIHADNPQAQKTIQHQLLVPIALSHILPTGVSGLFIAMLVFLMISTDATYLHSWGSIIIQDVIMPFRKKPFTPKQHIWMLRLGIVAVAVFAFFFGLFFNQVTYILMFFAITGAIWLGGAGAVILGGLYWKRGTTQGAYSGLIVGSTLSVIAIVLEQTWTKVVPILTQWFPDWQVLADYPDKFPINGQWMYLVSMIAAVTVYVIVSLVTCRQPFNMDRMLHRGQYAVENKGVEVKPGSKRRFSLSVFLGFDDQFTRSDKLLSWSVFIWTMLNFGIFVFVIVANLFSSWSNKAWANYFFVMSIVVPLIIGVITSVWFTIGGTWDLRKMFQRLRELRRNDLDDGRVIGHMNADDLARLGNGTAEPVTADIDCESATSDEISMPEVNQKTINLSTKEKMQ